MNVENGRKWSEALKSGQYKQCKSTMHGRDGHCCLGVAELISPANAEVYSYEGVKFWLGLGPGELDEFMMLNDYEHKTFPEIAAIIDQKLEEQGK